MCVCVCVCVCVVFIYTISISIICVSQEEHSLIVPNQQIYDFYKWIIFEEKDIVESNFLILVNYSFNVIKIDAVSTKQVV